VVLEAGLAGLGGLAGLAAIEQGLGQFDEHQAPGVALEDLLVLFDQPLGHERSGPRSRTGERIKPPDASKWHGRLKRRSGPPMVAANSPSPGAFPMNHRLAAPALAALALVACNHLKPTGTAESLKQSADTFFRFQRWGPDLRGAAQVLAPEAQQEWLGKALDARDDENLKVTEAELDDLKLRPTGRPPPSPGSPGTGCRR
jgi:hypothetical protein